MRREEEAAKKDDEVAGYVEPEPGPWREVHPDDAPFTKIQAGGRSIQKEEAEIQGRQSETKVREPTNERARHTRLCARQLRSAATSTLSAVGQSSGRQHTRLAASMG